MLRSFTANGTIWASAAGLLESYYSVRKQTGVKRYCKGLQLSEQTTQAILAEHVRRIQREPHTLYALNGDKFALVVKSALAYHDRTVDDLSEVMELSDKQKKIIAQGGAETSDWSLDNWMFRKGIVEAFRTLLEDEHYGEHEMLLEAKGSFTERVKPKSETPPKQR